MERNATIHISEAVQWIPQGIPNFIFTNHQSNYCQKTNDEFRLAKKFVKRYLKFDVRSGEYLVCTTEDFKKNMENRTNVWSLNLFIINPNFGIKYN